MYAKKANKVYRVDDITKETYLKQGFDICDDEGKVVERSKQATVPYAEYEKVTKELLNVKAELETAKAELETLKTSDKADNKKSDKKAESKSE